MAQWKVTVRQGPDVNRRSFDRLGDALAEARRQVEEITAAPPLKEVRAIRDYAPPSLTKARVEISGKGLLRPPTAGLDVRGDNSVVGYAGAIRRRPLKPGGLDAICRELERVLGDD